MTLRFVRPFRRNDKFSSNCALGFRALCAAIALFVCHSSGHAQESKGVSTGDPLPRFSSLRSDKVNVRQGPSREHPVVWTFTRAGLPIEITAEFDNWRRIRAADGSEGWVLQGLLSKRRTALVSPWDKGKTLDLFARPNAASEVLARVESGVLVSLNTCDATWCSVIVNDIDGYVLQEKLWGIYPRDKYSK